MPRLLEGERFLYKGIIHIVKGFQHPPGYIIAYPRYNYNAYPPIRWTGSYIPHIINWGCIGRKVPVIPMGSASGPVAEEQRDLYAEELRRLICLYSNTPCENISFTGSTGLNVSTESSDIDIVIYTQNPLKAYDALRAMREDNVTQPPSYPYLLHEYMKHRGVMSIDRYMARRSHSILLGTFHGRGYSVRIVPYTRGYMGCVDPVNVEGWYRGLFYIEEVVSNYTTPALYITRLENGERVILYTFRLLYAELHVGDRGYVEGELERAVNTGEKRLVPDRGVLIVDSHGYP